MQPDKKKLLRFLQSWIINTAAVLMTVEILHNHITYGERWQNLLITSFLLGILNAFVRPILMLIALPLLIFTLGLFTLVINALLLWLMTGLLPFFNITGSDGKFSFGYAFLGAILISIFSVILNIMTGNARVQVQSQRPPTPPNNRKDRNDGGGPVIDV
jgi:putative membrane protein